METRKVILIAGDKRAGKDTVADMIINKLNNAYKLSYAEPMKVILAETLGITLDQLEIRKNNELYSHRGYLQRFGQVCKRYFGENCWVEIVEHTIENLPNNSVVVLSDLRLPNEVLDGAITVKVVNPRIKNKDTHISENALKDYNFDITIVNDGTLEQLEDKVKDMLGRLRASGRLIE